MGEEDEMRMLRGATVWNGMLMAVSIFGAMLIGSGAGWAQGAASIAASSQDSSAASSQGTSASGRSAPVTEPSQTMPTLDRDNRMTDESVKRVVNSDRQKKIVDDTSKLLSLATELKADVDKTNEHTMSLEVIRKADEIEKLAHSVKENMKGG
jgi:hypothetical protein